MRIIYIAPSIIPSRSANSVHVFKMMHALKQLGYQASLIVPDISRGREKNVNNVFSYYGVKPFPFRYFPRYAIPGKLYIYSFILAIWLWFQKKHLVYSRDFYPAMFAALLGNKVLMEFHSPPLWSRGVIGWLIKRFYRSKNLKVIVVISEALKQIFIAKGFDSERIIVAHDGSDPQPESLSEYPLSGNFKVGYVGHLYKGRGVENIIYLANNNPSVDFHIAGGNEEDIMHWKTETQKLENIHFHGFIPPALTNSFRKGCDVLLAPYQKDLSIWGGGASTSAYMSPLKIFEYMAAGKPIICSDLPVLLEVLNQQNALLVQGDSMEAWHEALNKLLENDNLRVTLGSNALADFEKQYSWKQRASFIMEALKKKGIV